MKILSVLDNTEQLFTRPVVNEIANRVCLMLNIPEDITLKNPSTRKTRGSRIGQTNILTWEGAYHRVILTVEEVIDPSAIALGSWERSDTRPIFADVDNGIFIRPKYVRAKYIINAEVRTPNRPTAIRLQASIRQQAGRSITDYFHEATYHYAIPLEQLKVLERLSAHLSDNGLLSGTVTEWQQEHIHPKCELIADASNTFIHPSIKETQEKIIGRITNSDVSKEVSEGVAILNFTYEFHCAFPHSAELEYPQVIAGRPIPKDLRYYRPYTPSETSQNGNLTALTLRDLQKNQNSLHGMINIPTWDEWKVTDPIPPYIPFMSVMLNGNETVSFNLSDLEQANYGLDEDTLAYLIKHGNLVGNPRRSFIHVALYRDDSPIPRAIRIDETGQVTSSVPVDGSGTYRAVFSVVMAPLHLMVEHQYDIVPYTNTINRYLLGMGWRYEELLDRYTVDTLKPYWAKQTARAKNYDSNTDKLFTVNNFTIKVT